LDEENISASAIRTGVPMQPFKPDREWLTSYRRVAEQVHAISEPQGFWPDGPKTDIAYKIAHLMSELGEAYECARTGGADKNIPDMTGVEVQLADVLGILMDMEVAMGLKISEALLRKMEFNKTREFLHGKKF
jgi:NTP pyrophosphatase (non-canonical NTP hydrolase)